jgi:hypothetical protein
LPSETRQLIKLMHRNNVRQHPLPLTRLPSSARLAPLPHSSLPPSPTPGGVPGGAAVSLDGRHRADAPVCLPGLERLAALALHGRPARRRPRAPGLIPCCGRPNHV